MPKQASIHCKEEECGAIAEGLEGTGIGQNSVAKGAACLPLMANSAILCFVKRRKLGVGCLKHGLSEQNLNLN